MAPVSKPPHPTAADVAPDVDVKVAAPLATAGGQGLRGAPRAPGRARWATGLGWFIGGVLLLLLVAWGLVQWAILPNLDRLRVPIEQQASRLVGLPVNIGTLKLLEGGLRPTVEMTHVALKDGGGREALRLARVQATVSLRSLLSTTPRLDALLIDGAALDIRRDRTGRVHVAGMDLSAPEPAAVDSSLAADWLWQQPSLRVRQTTIRWIDERRGAPPLVLNDIDLTLSNARTRHDFSLHATPPAAWGDRMSLQGRFTQPILNRSGLVAASDWRAWRGQLGVQMPRVDVVELHRYVKLPFDLHAGHGALSAQVDWADGQWQNATAELDLKRVDLRLAPHLAPLDIAGLKGRVMARRDEAAQRTQIDLQGLGFTTTGGMTWPKADIRLVLLGAATAPTGGELSTDGIDLSVLALLTTRLPLAERTRQTLVQMQPRGHAEHFEASWQGPLDAPTQWRMQGKLKDLALNAQAVPLAAQLADQRLGRPGIEGARLDFAARPEGGEAEVAIEQGSLSFPGVFEQPRLAMQSLAASLTWQVDAAKRVAAKADASMADAALPMITVQARSLRFANADAAGELSGTWRTGAGQHLMGIGGRYPGRLDLQGTLSRGQATAVGRYLPLGLGAVARRYLSEAFGAGQLARGQVRVRGDLWAFPFKGPGSGEFKFSALADGVRMNVVPWATQADGKTPLWPVFNHLSGQIMLDRTALHIRGASGEVMGVQLQNIEGEVADLATDPVLALRGTAQGELQAMLRYLEATPVAGWIGHALATTTATGRAPLKLALQVPIWRPQQSSVRGELTLDGNDVRMNPDTPWLGRARGTVVFTEKSLTVQQARATVFGGEASFEGGTQADARLHFDGQGVITAAGFAQASELGAITRLARLMQGQTPYRLGLSFHGAQPTFTLTSDMRGMAVQAPAPLGKGADTALPLRVSTRLLPPGLKAGAVVSPSVEATHDLLRIQVGDDFQAHYVRELAAPVDVAAARRETHAAQLAGDPKVVAGGIGLGLPAPQPDRGVEAAIKLDQFDTDAWLAIARRLDLLATGPASSEPKAAPSGGSDDTLTLADTGYAPARVQLQTRQLLAGQRRLDHVKLIAHQAAADRDGRWRATVQADQLAGEGHWRPERPGSPAKVVARLTRLSLDDRDGVDTPPRATDPSRVATSEAASDNPPALDIVVDNLEWQGRALGRLEIDAAHERAGAAAGAGASTPHDQVWHLNRLRLTTPESQLDGTGQWLSPDAPGAVGHMVVNFRLRSEDSGAALKRLGVEDLIRGGRGLLQGQIAWDGSPLQWDMASLQGQLQVQVDEGQFLKANTGAARLLGLLSLQSLPRRLLLDFRDVVADGFSFDEIKGDLHLAHGVATTRNLRMRGLQAHVLMEGLADLRRATQDLHVWVVPEINAGAASLAYAAINPAIGLGTFLAQWFLRRPLIEAATRQFHVTGSWAEPLVTPMTRQVGDRIPELLPADEAEPNPSAPKPNP